MTSLPSMRSPVLPFFADLRVRWALNDAFEDVVAWNGSSWTPIVSSLMVAENNVSQYVEFSIPRSELNATDSLRVVGSIVFEASGFEVTYAFVPSSTPAGYDPDPADFLELALFQMTSVPSLATYGALVVITAFCLIGLISIRRSVRVGD